MISRKKYFLKNVNKPLAVTDRGCNEDDDGVGWVDFCSPPLWGKKVNK